MKLIEQVETTISKHDLLADGDQLVVGVSGGPDSLALLHILHRLEAKYDLQLHIAHVNHQLRGQDAEQDAEFVADIADRWGWPITIKVVDTQAYKKEEALSLEDAARQLRYDFFFDLQQELGFDKIAVAHQADDQVETILMKFIRGAGLKGLGAMSPQKNKIIRPLLAVTKEEIKSYCSHHDLQPRFDHTNAQPVQLRNKIRLELIPLLKEKYNENLVATLTRNAKVWRAENDFLKKSAQRERKQLTVEESEQLLVLDKSKYEGLHTALQRRIIRESIRYLTGDYQDIYYQHIKDVRQLALTGKTGSQVDLPHSIIAKLNYNQLIIMKESQRVEQDYFKIKAKLGKTRMPQVGLVVNSEVVSSSYPWQEELHKEEKAFLDFAKVGTEFYIRQREAGDRFYPLGLSGSKKVKDFLIDEKVPRWKRNQIPIFVTPDGEIFWVGTLRIDDRFKVTNSTEQILAIEINNLKEEAIC